MKYKYIAVVGIMIFFLVGTLEASEQRGALVLNKIPIYEFERDNIAMYDVKYSRNVSDMREFRDFLSQGRYEMTLRGGPGRTVTLYAQFNYGKNSGFLVVRKMDDQMVWIHDLENLPPGQWTTVEAGPLTGSYEAFYQKSSGFDQNISSVEWGQWWQGDTPEQK